MGGASEAYILVDKQVKPARDYQANALEENIINDAVDDQRSKYKEINHSYRDGTIEFKIIKTHTRLHEYPMLNFNEQKSLYTLIRDDGSTNYISQNRDTLVKLLP